jgi:hypothetical protein
MLFIIFTGIYRHNLQNGFLRFISQYISQIPIANTTEELKGRIRQQVEKIMQVQQELSALGTLYKHKKAHRTSAAGAKPSRA